MKQSEIKVGGLYIAKVSNQFVTVRVDEIKKREKNIYRRGGTYYSVTNMKTGRNVVFRSATKFRRPV